MNAIECIHHWILEGQNGPKTMGTCKKCSEQKEFSNVTEGRRRGRKTLLTVPLLMYLIFK